MLKHKKLLVILINLILMLFIISTTVFGTSLINKFNSSISTTGTGAKEVATKAGKIVGIIQVVGTIASVGMMIVIGIKYVMGSAEEKAEYKKTLIPYLIGAILIFGASNLTQVIYNWTKNSI